MMMLEKDDYLLQQLAEDGIRQAYQVAAAADVGEQVSGATLSSIVTLLRSSTS